MATPVSVKELFNRTSNQRTEFVPIAHFHDSRGTGLVNYVAAYDSGIRHFDSSFGGAGGHPAISTDEQWRKLERVVEVAQEVWHGV